MTEENISVLKSQLDEIENPEELEVIISYCHELINNWDEGDNV